MALRLCALALRFSPAPLGVRARGVSLLPALLRECVGLGRPVTCDQRESLLHQRLVLLALGAGRRLDREHRGHYRGHREERERNARGDRLPNGPAMLAYILTGQLVLGHPVHGRREIGDLVAKPSVGEIEERRRATGPAHVDVERLLLERARDRGTERVRDVPVEVVGLLVPEDLAVGEQHQQPVRAVLLPPVLDLALTPHRRRRVGRGEHEEEPRVFDRLRNR